MEDKIDTLAPMVTLEDIKKVFHCENDKAREIMNIPDLHKRPLGKTYYVLRSDWDKFIYNFIKYNGLRDLSRGFQFAATSPLPGAEWNKLIEIGFTKEELAAVIEDIKKDPMVAYAETAANESENIHTLEDIKRGLKEKKEE